MLNTLGTCFLRRFVGAPKHVLDCLVFNRYKKALFDEYEASDSAVMGTLIRQDTTGSPRGGKDCVGLQRGNKICYCYEDPNFGLMVVRPAVRMNIDIVTDNVQLKLLPDYPNSGYPQFLIEKWLRDYASWKIFLYLLGLYVPLTLLLSYLVAVVANILLINQYYPLCKDDIAAGHSCYFWFRYMFSCLLVILAGYMGARRSFQMWKYQMLEKEISGRVARELLQNLPQGDTTLSYERPTLHDDEPGGPAHDAEKGNAKDVTAPLIARV